MKKLLILTTILISSSYSVYAQQNCRDLPGFKKIGKDSVEYIKCLKESKKFKLKTESKLTDLMTGKKEFKLPNPLNGLKAIGKALKPSALEN